MWKSNTNSAHINCIALQLVSDKTNRTRVEFMFWYVLVLVWTEKMCWPKKKYDSEHLLPNSSSTDVTQEKRGVQEKYYYSKNVIYPVLVELVPPSLIGWSHVTTLGLGSLFSEPGCRRAPDPAHTQNGPAGDNTRNDNCTYRLKAFFFQTSSDSNNISPSWYTKTVWSVLILQMLIVL